MIVMFQGTNIENHGVTGAASIAAIMSAAKYNRKTLLIQLTNAEATNAQELLIGKKMQESQIRMETLRIEDKGIDALIRRAETSKLIKQNFDNACEALINFENMLDLASVTKKVDFEINLTVKDIRIILHHASEIYDNIFLLLNGKNTGIMQEILELADCIVTCIGQTPKKEPYNTFSGKRELKLVADYENDSQFSSMYLKKIYAAKKIYVMMHNSGYRDACLSGTLLEFVLKNMANSREDENFLFIKHLTNLIEGIMDKEDWTEKIPEPVYKDEPDDEEKEVLVPISENDYFTKPKVVKKGLFRKKVVDEVILGTLPEDEEFFFEDETEEEPENIYSDNTPDAAIPEETEPEEPELPQPEEKAGKRPKFMQKKKKSSLKADESKATGKEDSSDKVTKPDEESKKEVITSVTPNLRTMVHEETWICPSCGEENTKNFCMECGTQKPVKKSLVWKCPRCFTENTAKFCAECGTKKPDSNEWVCPDCGTKNTKKFCAECGRMK